MDSSSNSSSRRRQLLRLVSLSLAVIAVSFVGCTVDTSSFDDPGSGTGGQNGQPSLPSGQGDIPLPKTDVDCTVPEQGCLCDTEGEHVSCGKVVAKTGNGQLQCGKGVSTCTNGAWGECILTGLDTVTIDERSVGLQPQGTQAPTPCQNNPCNPYCWHFPDGPNDAGIADSGTNLDPQDGGIGTVWDAGPGPCTPLTKAQACAGGKNCGEVANGCGGILSCGSDTCPKAGEICGGNGAPNVCGKPPIASCTPLTKAQACTNGMNCGWVSDNCGGVVSCGNCTGQQLCGLGGPNICGDKCKPKSCNQLGKNCGLTTDGCGVTMDCGGCPPGQFCGAFTAGVCWAAGKCTPKTFAQACTNAGKNCGPIADGCGGTINCGTCSSSQLCGGGGVANVCGGTVCTPKTYQQACVDAGKNCGPISDGCGGLINCGTCQDPATCGGGGVANKCGTPANCTNLCLKQKICPVAGQTTSITGTVYAPNGTHPLPNVVVYVPNSAVPAFPSGITCENCAQAGGSPLVSTKTATDGTFKITNMPVGTNIPLVIQIGRWRRQVVIPTVTACTNTVVSPALTRLPRNKSEGDIPKIAVSTGCVDRMECVLRRMGIQDSEFTNPSGTGRVNFFKGGYCNGSYIGSSSSTPWESSLVSSYGTLDNYDMVLFPCQANEFYYTNGAEVAYQNNIANYVNNGGRAFFTHYNYHWLLRRTPTWNSPLYSAINWTPSQWFNNGTLQGTINTGFARGLQLAQWLQLPAISGSVGFGQVLVDVTRKDFSGWSATNTTNWLTLNNPAYPIHLTFDTPLNVAQTSKCGRVVFSDFHVYNGGGNIAFPNECPNNAMTPQEKLLEYMIFDLSSCVGSQPPPPACTKLTCAQQGITCGQAGDGCGGTLNCGPACPVPTCTPKTCAQMGAQCDSVGDGCGGVLNCGTCPANYLCSANKCQAVACVKDPCPTGPGTYCGPVPVGCQGDPNNTNKCPCTEPGETCGGSGITHKCGKPCVQNACPTGPGAFCGVMPDGCGSTKPCGCTAPETCGGSGVINKCGKPVCNPRSCVDQDISCGQAGDGCGNVINCGTCPSPLTCGGGGVPGKCGFVKVHSDGYFSRDYAANCPSGTAPYWQLWSWNTETPGDSFVDFTVQTSATEAGLASAPSDPLRYSLPPGPATLASQVVKAKVGTPDTRIGAASVDNTLQLNGRQRNLNYLRVTTHLAPTSDKTQTSLLKLWDMQVDCIPSE